MRDWEKAFVRGFDADTGCGICNAVIYADNDETMGDCDDPDCEHRRVCLDCLVVIGKGKNITKICTACIDRNKDLEEKKREEAEE